MARSKSLTLDLKSFLDDKVDQYNRLDFIENDPISIPHRFTQKADIEIAALFTALLAWGQRGTIIKSCTTLMEGMHNAPSEFILQHRAADLRRLKGFKHRTFNSTDLLYLISFLKSHYSKHASLEDLFLLSPGDLTIEGGLINFHRVVFGLHDYPPRTRKHVATPERKSACKRLNMFLRWMVRRDERGVDFGLWQRISPAQLVCPVDLHVERVARKLKLIRRKQRDWQTALELTTHLREFDPLDPVKYDFALFGLGIEGEF